MLKSKTRLTTISKLFSAFLTSSNPAFLSFIAMLITIPALHTFQSSWLEFRIISSYHTSFWEDRLHMVRFSLLFLRLSTLDFKISQTESHSMFGVNNKNQKSKQFRYGFEKSSMHIIILHWVIFSCQVHQNTLQGRTILLYAASVNSSKAL